MEESKVDPNHYANVFVTSDLHFGHQNILSYEQSRIDNLVQTKFDAEWINNKGYTIDKETSMEEIEEIQKEWRKEVILEHDKSLINNWNSVVKEKDLIYIITIKQLN